MLGLAMGFTIGLPRVVQCEEPVFKIQFPYSGFVVDASSPQLRVVIFVPAAVDYRAERVQLKIDNVFEPKDTATTPIQKDERGETFQLTWDSTREEAGVHRLKVYVKLTNEKLYAQTMDVKVIKSSVFTIVKPLSGNLLKSRVTFDVAVAEGAELQGFQCFIDGSEVPVQQQRTSASKLSLTVDTVEQGDGKHDVKIRMTAANGQAYEASVPLSFYSPWSLQALQSGASGCLPDAPSVESARARDLYTQHTEFVTSIRQLVAELKTNQPKDQVAVKIARYVPTSNQNLTGAEDANDVAALTQRRLALFRDCESNPTGDSLLRESFACLLVEAFLHKYELWQTVAGPKEITGTPDGRWFVHTNRGGLAKPLNNSSFSRDFNEMIGVLCWVFQNCDEQQKPRWKQLIQLFRAYPDSLQAAIDYTSDTYQKILNERQNRDRDFGRSVATATGFIVNPFGYIVTCSHVVGTSSQVRVSIGDATYRADVIRLDLPHDLALLKLATKKLLSLTALPIHNSKDVQVGQDVRAVGYPLSSYLGESPKVTRGTISGIVGAETTQNKTFEIDAPVNPGNSGGPLVNENGEVVGVIKAKLVGSAVSSVGFAVPSEYVEIFLRGEYERRSSGHAINSSKNVTVEYSTTGTEKMDGPTLAKFVSPEWHFLKR